MPQCGPFARSFEVAEYGLVIDLDRLAILTSAGDPGQCDPDDDPNCGTIEEIANSIVWFGDFLGDLPDIANYQIVGGVPNDGLVPTANEALPDKPVFRTLSNITHDEVLNDGTDLVSTLNAMTGR